MRRKISTTVLVLTTAFTTLFFIAGSAVAQTQPQSLRVAGLWRSGDGSKQVLAPGLPAENFITRRDELAQQGLAIDAIAVYFAGDGNQDNYVAVFEPTPNSESVTNLLSGTWEQFAAKDTEMFKKGYRLVDIALSVDRKDARKVSYTAVWRGGLGTGAQWTDPAVSWEEFRAKNKERFDKGLRLVAMDTIAVLDDPQEFTHKMLFVGTWRDGLGTGAFYLLPPSEWPAYTSLLTNYLKNGLRSIAFSACTVNGHTPMYVGAVRSGLGTPGERRSSALRWDEFVTSHKSNVAQGYRLIDISVYTEFEKID
jgi:hypothetical protein